MIMALSLLIYSIAKWMIRQKLKEYSETVLNQLGKPTVRPTLIWIFQKLRNINEAIFEFKGAIQREIINLNNEKIKIIKLIGQECEKCYV
jgi:transposase